MICASAPQEPQNRMKECIIPLYLNTNTTEQHWGAMHKTDGLFNGFHRHRY